MNLLIMNYFDIGISFGINDHPFLSDERIEKLKTKIGCQVNYPACNLPVGINLPIGKGIRINLLHSAFIEEWLTEARKKAESIDLIKLFDSISVNDCYMDVYSVGLAIFRLDIYGLLPELYEMYVELYQCFEYSGYEKVSGQLKSICLNIINSFSQGINIEKISKRYEIINVNDFDLIPGFICIFICNNSTDQIQNVIKVAQEYERQYKFKELDLDDGILHLGWACGVFIPRTGDYNRVLYLIQISQLYYGISEAFEQIFSLKMIDSVRNILGEMDIIFDSATLNSLKTLSSSIVELTLFSSTSNNISDLFFFEAFNDISKMSFKQQRIHRISDIFNTVQSEKNRLEENKKEKRLGNFIFFLTSLTFISVLADIINTVDYIHKILPNPITRFFILVIPLIGLLITIWFFFVRRPVQSVNRT